MSSPAAQMTLAELADRVLRRIEAGEACPPKTQEALRAVLPPHPSCPAGCPARRGGCGAVSPARVRDHLSAEEREQLDARDGQFHHRDTRREH